jgi:hypothetical protein
MSLNKLSLSLLILIAFILSFAPLATSASFKKNLIPQWVLFNPLSTETISHTEWQQFLDKYLRTNQEGINLIDYKHIKLADKQLLKQYIDRLSKTDISEFNRNEQLAYWLNLYNALTVNIIIDYYPIQTIQDIQISPGIFSIGPWGAKVVTINHIDLSLDDIHNRIIRPIWNDNRTHYTINNSAIGAPNLNKMAFSGHNIQEILNQSSANYINSHRGIMITKGKLYVSKMYRWFLEDFGDKEIGIINHLKQYAKPELKQKLDHIHHITGYHYNWHLNTQ